MTNVTPAILPFSFEELTDKLSRIEGLSPVVQIDICDGVFGLDTTWLPEGTEVLPSGTEYEFDLMVDNWSAYVEKCILLKAKRIVVHVDHMSDDELRGVCIKLKEQGIHIGIAVSNDVSVETHAHALRIAREIDYRSYAQVMGIEKIGEQGHSFDESAPSRIVSLKQQVGDVDVQVDGAMNPTNAPKVIQAGATRLVVGSYMFTEGEPAKAYELMTNIPSVCD
jgi:ribulose-phosphate 3-epimerase